MVAVGLPCVGLYGWLSGRGLFFHRGNTKRQQLAELIERHISFKKAPLIYYPEGHRNVLPSPLTIKHGGIKMCFEKKWTLQLSITAGKERALAEKNFTLQFFTPCYWILSSPLNPNNYSSFEEFYEAVDQEWQRMWELSYHSSRHSFERYKHPGVSFCFNFNRRWLIGWGVLFLFHLGYYNFVYS